MGYAGLKEADKRADVLAYLRSLLGQPRRTAEALIRQREFQRFQGQAQRLAFSLWAGAGPAGEKAT